MKILIDIVEFQQTILNIIRNKDYEKYMDSTIYKSDKIFEMGFIQGMNWAALNASQCNPYYYMEKNTNERLEENN